MFHLSYCRAISQFLVKVVDDYSSVIWEDISVKVELKRKINPYLLWSSKKLQTYYHELNKYVPFQSKSLTQLLWNQILPCERILTANRPDSK